MHCTVILDNETNFLGIVPDRQSEKRFILLVTLTTGTYLYSVLARATKEKPVTSNNFWLIPALCPLGI